MKIFNRLNPHEIKKMSTENLENTIEGNNNVIVTCDEVDKIGRLTEREGWFVWIFRHLLKQENIDLTKEKRKRIIK